MDQNLNKPDITNLEAIKTMVDNFYGKVREDQLIGPIFDDIIKDRWSEHLEKMYRFWQTILLDEYTYYGSPFPPHAKLPIEKQHFDRWLTLFYATVDEYFAGKKSEEAKWRASKMAEMFNYKINYHNKTIY